MNEHISSREQDVNDMKILLDHLDQRFNSIETRIDRLETSIENKFDKLESRLNEKIDQKQDKEICNTIHKTYNNRFKNADTLKITVISGLIILGVQLLLYLTSKILPLIK